MAAKPFFVARKTYNPAVEGFGSPDEWSDAFQSRMGFSEAQEVMADSVLTPRGILGVSAKAVWAEIKAAYRKAILANHPDRIKLSGLTLEAAVLACKKINAAYAVLAREFGQ